MKQRPPLSLYSISNLTLDFGNFLTATNVQKHIFMKNETM